MNADRLRLTKEKETLLPTLYGKAIDSRSPNSILHDTFAADIVSRLDFDFATLDLPKGAEISLSVRAKHLDDWTREFLAANPVSTVLHLGCGLDSRVLRIDPSPDVRWYDVDQAEVIELRRTVYEPRPGYTMIATSVTDVAWLDRIATDRPVLVVAEGLVIYLHEHDGIALLRAITERFPHGEIVFDAYSRFMLRMTRRLKAVKNAGATVHWSIDDPSSLEREVPRLKLVSAVPFLTMPLLMDRMARAPWQRRLNVLLARFDFVKRLVQHLRYRF